MARVNHYDNDHKFAGCLDLLDPEVFNRAIPTIVELIEARCEGQNRLPGQRKSVCA